jgi:hypothetical protein
MELGAGSALRAQISDVSGPAFVRQLPDYGAASSRLRARLRRGKQPPTREASARQGDRRLKKRSLALSGNGANATYGIKSLQGKK